MELAKYKACICEGAAENAIMDILLDKELLVFSREEMLEESVIRCRDGKKFEQKYLRKGFAEKISVIRILDSRREKFKIGKAYEHKIDVINVITAPEIEMLIIFAENQYKEFKKSGKKPSDFCKENLRMSDVKSYDYVFNYFSNSRILVKAIKAYHRTAKIPNDIKVKFDNGEIVKTRWERFSTGSVAVPSCYARNHIGDKKIQNRGNEEAEIIEVKDANHITVKFKDGTIVKDRKYEDFIHGAIGKPGIPQLRRTLKNERLWTEKIMRNGMKAKIVRYGSANDIDIKFSNGTIVLHKTYANFCSGSVACK